VVEVDPGNPVEVRCNVDATPLNNSTLTWKRDNFKFEGRVRYRMTETGSVMTLMNATREDSGQFTCVANNGVPGRTRASSPAWPTTACQRPSQCRSRSNFTYS